MLEKLYLRKQDGCSYEVIDQAENPGSSPRWILWSERLCERRTATEAELVMQIGWELVGNTKYSSPLTQSTHDAPQALMN